MSWKNLVLVVSLIFSFLKSAQAQVADLVSSEQAEGVQLLQCSSSDMKIRAELFKQETSVNLHSYHQNDRTVVNENLDVPVSKSSATASSFLIEFIDLEDVKGIEVKADLKDGKWIGVWTDYGSPGMESTSVPVKCQSKNTDASL